MFKPKRLGELSKDNTGGHRNVLVPFKDPNFRKSDFDEIMRIAKKNSKKPPLPPSVSAPLLKKNDPESMTPARDHKKKVVLNDI